MHPTIVPVHEVGLADGVPYLVSEFVEGLSLSDLLTSRQLAPREAAELVATVAEALQYAHEDGVIHRDVKPSNILFDGPGKPHLVDFGLAKALSERWAGCYRWRSLCCGNARLHEPRTGGGATLNQVDMCSDVYTLGVILYRLLTGELPFRGNTRMLLHQVLNEEPSPPRKLNDHIPRDLETITLKAMAKEPARRYATAGELAADVKRWLSGEPILARPVGFWERAWRWRRRRIRFGPRPWAL